MNFGRNEASGEVGQVLSGLFGTGYEGVNFRVGLSERRAQRPGPEAWIIGRGSRRIFCIRKMDAICPVEAG